MALRTTRERIIQTLAYEGIGLILAAPLLAATLGHGGHESAMLLALIAGVVLIWAPIHNTGFDLLDLRLTGRTACERPHWLRILHACSYETSCIVFTLPIFVWQGGFTLTEALMADLLLTLFYVGYAYVFHLVYDWLRPVRHGQANTVAMFPAVMPARVPSQEPAPDKDRDQDREHRQQIEGQAAQDRQDQVDPAIRRADRGKIADQRAISLGQPRVIQLVGQAGVTRHAFGLGQPVGLGPQAAR